MNSTLIIAEAGVNHNGSIDLARRLVDAAAAAGADCVKFQTFRAELLVTQSAKQAEYQTKNIGKAGESQLEMLQRLELSEGDHMELVEYCKTKNIRFLSTAFDLKSIELLKGFGMPFWKVPSGELTNFPYLRAIGQTGQPVVLSTGMATIEEIEATIGVLTHFGTPREQITLLHCTTEYPAPYESVNLRAMDDLRERFGLKVGYSDHTEGIAVAVAAAALGAAVVEKHFTLDRSMEGPDHRASLEPDELKQMVAAIRQVECALGDGKKRPAQAELKNRPIARRSIVAARPIAAGELLTEDNLTAKRPAGGVSPMEWERAIGTKARRAFEADEQIEL